MSSRHRDIAKPLCNALEAFLRGFIFKEVDEITLTGTSGTATVVNNGVSKTVTFATSLTVTATNFVTANAAAYLAAGTVLTSDGAKLIFTASVPGVAFTGSTTIVNATGNLSGTVAANDKTYPVYLTIPKTPAAEYVYIGNVLHNEDGTKDTFIYYGTVQVQVVVSGQQTAENSLASDIIDVIRGLLLPTRSEAVTLTSPLGIIAFNPGSYNEMTEQSEGLTKVTLIDLYEFIIQ